MFSHSRVSVNATGATLLYTATGAGRRDKIPVWLESESGNGVLIGDSSVIPSTGQSLPGPGAAAVRYELADGDSVYGVSAFGTATVSVVVSI